MLPNYDKANQKGICLNMGTGTLGFDPLGPTMTKTFWPGHFGSDRREQSSKASGCHWPAFLGVLMALNSGYLGYNRG